MVVFDVDVETADLLDATHALNPEEDLTLLFDLFLLSYLILVLADFRK